jgi:hypothetical protein
MGKYKTTFYYYREYQIIALYIFSGDVLWITDLDDSWELVKAQVFEDDYIYVVTDGGNYYKLDTSGEILTRGDMVLDYPLPYAESFSSYDENTLELIAWVDVPYEELVYYVNKKNLEIEKVERIDRDTQEWEIIYENQ